MIALVVLLMVVLLAIGVPVAIAMGAAPVIALWQRGMPLVTIPQNAFEVLDSFALLAVIYFVLAGKLMQASGIARRLIDLAVALVGWMRGGLGSATVLTAMMFSTMSGSSAATAAAIGGVIGPEMKKQKYPPPFTASVVASSAELGVIIPPSVPMIIYGVMTGVSISDLFLAGILPGLLIGCSLILLVLAFSVVKGYGERTSYSFGIWARNVATAVREAWLALLSPIIILGGIYGGYFTPTEAAVVAVVYTLFLGLFVYRELELSALPRLFYEAAYTTAVVMIIIAFASVLAYVLILYRIPVTISGFVVGLTDDPLVFLLVVNILLLIVGTFLEGVPAIIIVTPILAPLAAAFEIDPVHFGVIVIANLALGMVTPPVGINLFIACTTFNVKMEALMRPLSWFLLVLIIDMLIISYVPWLSTVFLG
ncbi:TRAP transporter large permease [Chelativorans sp. Marseille-P2723]|uniref:TRAP transporter large permease n=1 Tax=Chelativorans sp. Marseille-P2723 TaxID=2709133 RepID=UPI00157094F0|nr:TRAP transporter large permease [Chelativorans sp. Marseille-P2723]